MPTTTYHRHWCATCKDWMPFLIPLFKKEEDKIKCYGCDTEHKSILLKDIPKEKLEEQRARYKENRRQGMNRFLAMPFLMGLGNPLDELMMDRSRTEIVEADAGQKSLDKIKDRKRAEAYEKRRIERVKELEEIAKYKGTRRNETCPCESGIKYKKCCLDRIKNYE